MEHKKKLKKKKYHAKYASELTLQKQPTHTSQPHVNNNITFTLILTTTFKNQLRANNIPIHTMKPHHTGEKTHKCTNCKYACSHPGDLKKHMRTHTGEKPYKCDKCGFQSVQSSGLKAHIKTHTGEKPFNCTVCSYKSSRSGDLRTSVTVSYISSAMESASTPGSLP